MSPMFLAVCTCPKNVRAAAPPLYRAVIWSTFLDNRFSMLTLVGLFTRKKSQIVQATIRLYVSISGIPHTERWTPDWLYSLSAGKSQQPAPSSKERRGYSQMVRCRSVCVRERQWINVLPVIREIRFNPFEISLMASFSRIDKEIRIQNEPAKWSLDVGNTGLGGWHEIPVKEAHRSSLPSSIEISYQWILSFLDGGFRKGPNTPLTGNQI